MKSTTYTLIETIALLDPAKNRDQINFLGLKLTNGETVFVEDFQIAETFLTAKTAGIPNYHMIPLSALVSFEVGLKNPKNIWFTDAKTLPDIICKLRIEQKKAA